MWGTIVNVMAIVGGTLMGLLLSGGLPERMRDTLLQAIGLAVVLVGFQMAQGTENVLVVLVSLVLGGAAGEALKIEDGLEAAGQWLEKKVEARGTGTVGKAFVTASLIYCVGPMAIMGSLEGGLLGQYRTLYTKSLLDGLMSVVLGSTLGVGVAFSAIPVFLFQGGVTLLAAWMQQFLSADVVREMTATGGLLIVGIGINVLGIKQIKVGNLLPSILAAFFLTWLLAQWPGLAF